MRPPVFWKQPLLALVMDRGIARDPLPELVEQVVQAGVDWIQIRERALEARELLEFAQSIAAAARRGARRSGRDLALIVNRRIDLALALGADGAHLGFDALAVADARSLLGESAWLGVSAHHPDEVAAAALAGASYAHLAPIFLPLSKRAARPALGLEPLRLACKCGIPVIAQGGVDASQCASLIEAGASGVAVTGAILMAEDPVVATADLRRSLDDAG